MKNVLRYIFALFSVFLLGFGVAMPSTFASDMVDYNDVKTTNSHYQGIQWLTKQGIQGYEDGSFGVYKSLTRPHAAIMFTRALSLNIPNKNDVTKYYNDVDSSDTYAEFMAAVGESEIFKGSNGKFLPDEKLTRQQMASTLVNAFALESGEKHVNINLDNVSETHKGSIQILADLGITNQTEDFRPKEIVTRGQFATFLYLSNKIANVKEVEAIDDIIVDMGTKEGNLKLPKEIKVLFNDGTSKTQKVNWDVSDLDLNRPGKYIISGVGEELPVETTATVIVNSVELEECDSITVMKGSKNEDIPLPKQIKVTTSDGTNKDIKVEWDISNLDLSQSGENVVTGSLEDTTLTTSIKVIVQNLEIENFEPIEVFSGIEKDELDLPKTVQVTYGDEKSENVEVTWDLTDLDLNKPGEYHLNGDLLSIPDSASIKVIVKKEFPDSVSIEQKNLTIKEGQSVQLRAEILPEDAVKNDLEWTSSDDSVLTVNDNGEVTAVSEGEADITVSTQNGKTDGVKITVSNKPSLYTKATSNVVINGLIKQLSMQIINMDTVDVSVEKVEVYEKNKLYTTYTKEQLESNDINAEIASGKSWGMSISSKLGIWEENSYVKYYIKSNNKTYEFVDQLDN